ncbi:hypothetical protein [Capnocytophaga cynodegmi]|uniref:hypothetical protein n=1 Tax=Capnocytophaga cynodegmi TaxID=28189 RepID=UPI00385A68F0
MAEVAGAVGNIAVNTQTINPNSNTAKVIDAYNLAMGAIGLKNLGQGGYKFVKNLPEQTKKLLQQNKSLRNELVAKYLEWQTLITKIDDLTDTEKQLIAQQEKVWKVLGFEDKINNIASFISRWDDLSREEVIILYKKLSGTIIKPLSKKNVTQKEVLKELESVWKTDNGKNFVNPYSFIDKIEDIVLEKDAIFIRAFSEYETGRWMLSLEEFRTLKSTEDLVKKTALPLIDNSGKIIYPDKLTLVRVPKGTTIRRSIARPQDWGGQGHLPGGAIQYEIRDFDWKTMGDWFQELGPINNYIGK